MPRFKRFHNPQKSAPGSSIEASSQSIEASSQSAPEVSQKAPPSKNPVTTPSWNVEAIDLTGAIKHIKVKAKQVNNLPSGLRILVDFNEQDSAYGDAQGLLAGFLGILACDCNLFPIDFERWTGGKVGIPEDYFDDCFATIIKERCRKNKENRSKQVIPHTGGSKANSRRRHEIFLETGKLPSRAQMYILTHTKKDGSFVNDAAKGVVEKLEVGLTQSTVDETQISPSDTLGITLGEEHSGRVRCMGMGATPSNTFRNTRLRLSSLSCSSSSQWQEKHNNLENAFKAYLIMKEGRIPEEMARFFAPEPDVIDTESESGTDLEASGSFGASNI